VSRAVALLGADARRLARDPMLRLLAFVPPALAVAVWAGEPRFDAWLRARGTLMPEWATPGATIVLLLIAPMMFGFLAGLMLLDERDEGVLEAVALTPVGTRGVLAYRMSWPALWSAATAVLVLALFGGSPSSPAALLAVPVLSALQTPLLAFFLGAFAGNKVDGMALSKVGSMLIGVGAAGVLLPSAWQWLALWSPHYWLARVVLASVASPAGEADATGHAVGGHGGAGLMVLAVALLVHLAALAGLARLYARRVG